jgi:SAM-dependent methyltransferase
MSNIEFWDNRYQSENYAYGLEPNVFFRKWLDKLSPGRILLPAEGEGRNAVYAAKKGWEVYAFDTSSQAKKKAIELAKLNNVSIHYECKEFEDLNLEKDSFDAIGLIFAHFAGSKRKEFHKELIKYLKAGGYIILEGFSKNQLEYQKKFNSGGPTNIELLFSSEEIEDDFRSLHKIYLAKAEIMLNEGLYHNGLASVVRYVGRK